MGTLKGLNEGSNNQLWFVLINSYTGCYDTAMRARMSNEFFNET